MLSVKGINTRHFQEGGSKINKAHKIMHYPAGIADSIGPHDGQRQVIGIFIDLSLYPGEGHAVITGHDNDLILQFSIFFQDAYGIGHQGIEALYLQGLFMVAYALLGIVYAVGVFRKELAA